MTNDLNIANTIFPGFNDRRGIVLCGYEWGFSKQDKKDWEEGNISAPLEAEAIFSNKALRYGERALTWRYDNRILKWFELWGHPLSRVNLGGAFEKCIAQTNWCRTQNYEMDRDYYSKLTEKSNAENFLHHINALEPAVLIFFGSVMIDALQAPLIKTRFSELMGKEVAPLSRVQKDYPGRRFRVGFQSFERCDVVSFPHPSSSRGLSDGYIALFNTEMSRLIEGVKIEKGVVSA